MRRYIVLAIILLITLSTCRPVEAAEVQLALTSSNPAAQTLTDGDLSKGITFYPGTNFLMEVVGGPAVITRIRAYGGNSFGAAYLDFDLYDASGQTLWSGRLTLDNTYAWYELEVPFIHASSFLVVRPNQGQQPSVREIEAYGSYPERPPAPAGVIANVQWDSVTLTWSPADLAQGYRVVRDGDVLDEVDEPRYTDTTVEPETTYTYWVVAYNWVGESPPSDPVTVTTPERPQAPEEPPGPVRGLRYTAGPNRVVLRWLAPVSGGLPDSYSVARDGQHMGTTQDSMWVDTTVAPGTEYEYSVVAVNTWGLSEQVVVTVHTPEQGVLAGVSPDISGLGRQVGAGLQMFLAPFLLAAGLILARIILVRGLQWVGGLRRG